MNEATNAVIVQIGAHEVTVVAKIIKAIGVVSSFIDPFDDGGISDTVGRFRAIHTSLVPIMNTSGLADTDKGNEIGEMKMSAEDMDYLFEDFIGSNQLTLSDLRLLEKCLLQEICNRVDIEDAKQEDEENKQFIKRKKK